MRFLLLIFLLVHYCFHITAQNGNETPAHLSLSYNDAFKLMQNKNRMIQIADKEIKNAHIEHNKIRATWLPSLQGSGNYIHLSEPIEVRQSLSNITKPIEGFIHEILPEEQIITNLLSHIGSYTLAFPLTPRNLTSIDLTAEWVLFTGGKRIYASKIGESLIKIAQENKNQVEATQSTLLVESYFGLQLAQEIVRVKQETLNNLTRHYNNAIKLEANGMINKAERLLAQVNKEEAQRELKAAEMDADILQKALQNMLGLEESSLKIVPTTPLFVNEQIPTKEYFIHSMRINNYTLSQIELQSNIVQQQIHMEQSAYLPNIAIFGKQTLYSRGIQSNLLPRTIVGIGFSWNLFDGTMREQRIRQTQLTQQTLALEKAKVHEDLELGIDKFYDQLEKAKNNIHTLNTNIKLNEELVRIRTQSFIEGMATSNDVIDAENLLATIRIARLAAYYEYDIALINLLSLCSSIDMFEKYFNM